jgi:hypothetical protein
VEPESPEPGGIGNVPFRPSGTEGVFRTAEGVVFLRKNGRYGREAESKQFLCQPPAYVVDHSAAVVSRDRVERRRPILSPIRLADIGRERKSPGNHAYIGKTRSRRGVALECLERHQMAGAHNFPEDSENRVAAVDNSQKRRLEDRDMTKVDQAVSRRLAHEAR